MAGSSRPRSKKPGRAWARRQHAGGARPRTCARVRVCSACTPSWRPGSTDCRRPGAGGAVCWSGTATMTFSDDLSAVRRQWWAESLLPQAGERLALQKFPEPVQELLLTTLAPAT